MATATELKQQLADTEAAIETVLKTGQAYGVTNSHNVTNASLDQLEKRAQLLRHRLYRLNGYTGRNYAQFQ
jgi:hypothetical protein